MKKSQEIKEIKKIEEITKMSKKSKNKINKKIENLAHYFLSDLPLGSSPPPLVG